MSSQVNRPWNCSWALSSLSKRHSTLTSFRMWSNKYKTASPRHKSCGLRSFHGWLVSRFVCPGNHYLNEIEVFSFRSQGHLDGSHQALGSLALCTNYPDALYTMHYTPFNPNLNGSSPQALGLLILLPLLRRDCRGHCHQLFPRSSLLSSWSLEDDDWVVIINKIKVIKLTNLCHSQ